MQTVFNRKDAEFILGMINSCSFPGVILEQATDLKRRCREVTENTIREPEAPQE